ncbi:unnamed protein product [Aspergillus oryzae]|nr:unnamed protein product [Aspergillus oryzae]
MTRMQFKAGLKAWMDSLPETILVKPGPDVRLLGLWGLDSAARLSYETAMLPATFRRQPPPVAVSFYCSCRTKLKTD